MDEQTSSATITPDSVAGAPVQTAQTTPEQLEPDTDPFVEGLAESEGPPDSEQNEFGGSLAENEKKQQDPPDDPKQPPDGESDHPTPSDDDRMVELTYLGEKKMLPLDQVRTLAQKGMNYDRMLQKNADRVAQLEAELQIPRASDAALAVLSRYARAAGGSVEQLIAQMSAVADQKGIPPVKVPRPDVKGRMEQAAVAEWKAFLKAFPEIRDPKTELAPEVWEGIRQGMTPRQAYLEYQSRSFDAERKQLQDQIDKLNAQLETLQKNEKNRIKSPGSLRAGAAAAEPTADEFLRGFLETE